MSKLKNFGTKTLNGLGKGGLKGFAAGSLLSLIAPPVGVVALATYISKELYNEFTDSNIQIVRPIIKGAKNQFLDIFGKGTNTTSSTSNSSSSNRNTINDPNQSPEQRIQGEISDIDEMIKYGERRSKEKNIPQDRIDAITDLLDKQDKKINQDTSITSKGWFGRNKTIPSLSSRVNQINDINKRFQAQDKIYKLEDRIQAIRDKLNLPAPTLNKPSQKPNLNSDYEVTEGQDFTIQLNNISLPRGSTLDTIEIKDSQGTSLAITYDINTKTVTIPHTELGNIHDNYTISYTITNGSTSHTSSPKDFSLIVKPNLNNLNSETAQIVNEIKSLIDPSNNPTIYDLNLKKVQIDIRILELKKYETLLTGQDLQTLQANITRLEKQIDLIDQTIATINNINNPKTLPIIATINNEGSNIVGEEAILVIPSNEIIDNGSPITFTLTDKNSLPIAHTIDTSTPGEHRIIFTITELGQNDIDVSYTRSSDNSSSVSAQFSFTSVQATSTYVTDLNTLEDELSKSFIQLPYDTNLLQTLSDDANDLKAKIDLTSNTTDQQSINNHLETIHTLMSVHNVFDSMKTLSEESIQSDVTQVRQDIKDQINTIITTTTNLNPDAKEVLDQIITLCEMDEYFRDPNNTSKDNVSSFLSQYISQTMRDDLKKEIYNKYITNALVYYSTLPLNNSDIGDIQSYIIFSTQEETTYPEFSIIKDLLIKKQNKITIP